MHAWPSSSPNNCGRSLCVIIIICFIFTAKNQHVLAHDIDEEPDDSFCSIALICDECTYGLTVEPRRWFSPRCRDIPSKLTVELIPGQPWPANNIVIQSSSSCLHISFWNRILNDLNCENKTSLYTDNKTCPFSLCCVYLIHWQVWSMFVEELRKINGERQKLQLVFMEKSHNFCSAGRTIRRWEK